MNALQQYFDESATPSDLRMLVHARVWEADGGLGKRFEEFRSSTLARPHDVGALAAEISKIRKELAKSHENGGHWETRRRPGGLAELELAAEYLQLGYGRLAPAVLVHGLSETFDAAGEHGLIDGGMATELSQAVSLWQNLEGYFRMTCGGEFRPESATEEQKSIIADMCGVDRFDELSGLLPHTALRTARLIDRLLAG